MIEGIYIVSDIDSGVHTGFVVFFERGKYCISKFTACTWPFIMEHAKARIPGPEQSPIQVFTCTLED